ncbi:rhomboid family intramembrane serine protease [Bacillus gobiensis]|uniref:rhomboid family intramembrane serine protease n=1 Tax=Bacillus gobiensis TaxID=1441095 RepID=UPI003D23AF45
MFVRNESFRSFISLYPIVSALTAIQILLWLVFQFELASIELLIGQLIGYNFGVANGEWWRLVTPIFMHQGFTHLLFNSVSLILFAPGLERMLGKIRFIFLYLGSGIIGNLGTYFLGSEEYYHLGASGAIFGLFGTYLYIYFYRKELMSRSNSQMIVTIIVISLIMTFAGANTNILAHIFGLIGGFALSPIVLSKKSGRPF